MTFGNADFAFGTGNQGELIHINLNNIYINNQKFRWKKISAEILKFSAE